MAGDLTRAWHKGNRPVEKVAFLAHRAIPVVNGLKIGGLTTLSQDYFSSSLAQLNPTLYSENVTSHDSGTYICRLDNGLGLSVEVQTVLEVREERPATVVFAPSNVTLMQAAAGKVSEYI